MNKERGGEKKKLREIAGICFCPAVRAVRERSKEMEERECAGDKTTGKLKRGDKKKISLKTLPPGEFCIMVEIIVDPLKRNNAVLSDGKEKFKNQWCWYEAVR